MTTIGMRWLKADDNFREQIARLMLAMKTKSLAQVAKEAGLVPSTFYAHHSAPGKMSRREERKLVSLFERYGVPYDPTWGEGVPGDAAVVR